LLLIEDDADVRRSIAETLTEAGHEVVEAENGKHALELLNQASTVPDVVLLDLLMPEMSGWQFRSALKADVRFAAIPVIVMTAERSRAAATLDADFHVHKPFAAADMLSTLEKAFQLRDGREIAAQAASSAPDKPHHD